jgi:glycosyltransferase involved in cell wall biosynthesis
MIRTDSVSSIRPMTLPPLCENPLVSVVITAYNYAEFIGAALESVTRQSYRDVEVVVADDGSTDETPSIVERYQGCDGRVRLLRGQNVGQPANTSRGFAATSGEIICFLDADDEYMEGKIEATVEAFHRYQDCGLCVHRMQKVDERGRPFGAPFPKVIDSGWLLERLLANGGRCSFPATSAISIRRAVGNRIFPTQCDSPRVGDAYIHYPAAFLSNVCVIPDAYSTYRCHRRSMSRGFTSALDCLRAQLQEFEEVFSTNRRFVARALGGDIAARMKLTDSQDVVERALGYLLVSGKPEYEGLSAASLFASLSNVRRKRLWRIILGLPGPTGRLLFLFRRGLLDVLSAARQASPRRPVPPSRPTAVCDFLGSSIRPS